MLYLAIDQHRKQLTVNLRNEAGRRDPETSGEHGMEAGAGVFGGSAESECAGRRVCSDRGGLRLQRLVLETVGGVRLPGDRARPAGEAEQEQDRPSRRRRPGRTAVDQPAAAAGGQEGSERAADRSAFRTATPRTGS